MTKERLIRSWAKSLGVRVTITSQPVPHSYERRHIRLVCERGGSRTQALMDVCHDLGHFVVAPPATRDLVNFGLGPGPFDSCRDCAACRNQRVATDTEESHASLLGILMVAHSLGTDEAISDLNAQNWDGAEALDHMRTQDFRTYAGTFKARTGVDLFDFNTLLLTVQT